MATKANARFSVNVGGIERRLFSIRERAGGDLLIVIRSATSERNLETRELGRTINEQRYSIHRSLASEDGISTIKHTIGFRNQTTVEDYHFTRVLKNRQGFAFLFTKRCTDFDGVHYKLKTEESVSIGRLNTDQFTL